MIMLSGWNRKMTLELYTQTLVEAAEKDEISLDRIDDAVLRILQVKRAMRLVRTESSMHEEARSSEIIDSQAKYTPSPKETALEAAKQSLVLLENKGETLPVDFG